MNARALVVEDEAPARNYLVQLLQQTGRVQVAAAVPSTSQARAVLTQTTVDVAFVDVRLGSAPYAGLDLARWLAAEAPSVPVVMVTAARDHAVEAFELGIKDYLLKPYTSERVSACLTRVESLLRARPLERPRIVARQGPDLVFLDCEELRAFEASARLVTVHSVRGAFAVDLSLAALESVLGPFVLRVHRNWLVSRAHVTRLARDNGELHAHVRDLKSTVPVARDRRAQVRDALLARTVGLREGMGQE